MSATTTFTAFIPARATAVRRPRPANPHLFENVVELTMTGIVLVACLLFAAGLLRAFVW